MWEKLWQIIHFFYIYIRKVNVKWWVPVLIEYEAQKVPQPV